jgi:hypothetical protein
MTIKDMFFTRPPPTPVLPAVQQLDRFLNSIREKNALVLGEDWRNLMSYSEARNRFETGRLNTDTGVIETLDGCKHSCEEITVTTPLNHKVKVRMKNLGDDVWDTTLVYVRQPHRVGKFKGWEHALQAATKKAIEIADATLSRSGHLPGR